MAESKQEKRKKLRNKTLIDISQDKFTAGNIDAGTFFAVEYIKGAKKRLAFAEGTARKGGERDDKER